MAGKLLFQAGRTRLTESLRRMPKAELFVKLCANVDKPRDSQWKIYDPRVDVCNSMTINRFLLRNHRLLIETGSWKRPKIPRHKRLCVKCNVLEDETHVLFQCEKYTDLRDNYMSDFPQDMYINCTNDTDKLREILYSGNTKVINNLAVLIRRINEKIKVDNRNANTSSNTRGGPGRGTTR